MIHKEQGEHVAECNECGLSEFGGTLEFDKFVRHLQDAGWKITKDEDEWVHCCPDCIEEERVP
jgi:hypothetical protein